MNSYIPQSPVHYALCYIPFTYSTDPSWGLIAFLTTTSNYIQSLKADDPLFNSNAERLSIESEEPNYTFGIVDEDLEEFIFGMMNKEIFEILSAKLNLTIYRKDSDITTSKFSANDLFGVVESMIRELLIGQILEDLT